MEENDLSTQIKNLPKTPGIYIYKDTDGKVLYVGKAKNLKNRIRSYFVQNPDLGPAKDKMVGLIASLDTISTDTELEALVLEANLVRKYQPPYNVLLRDDKFYLFIKITKDETPRIFPVRRIIKDGARYFGPYSSAASVRATLRLLRRIFQFKGEKETVHDIIFPHPLFSKVSPPFQGGAGGGENKHLIMHPTQPPLEKGRSTNNVIAFLKGNRGEIIRTLEHGIAESAKNLEFERAALFRDQLNAVLRLEGSQKVYLQRKESFDVISIAQDATQSAGNVLQIREGKLLGKQTFLLKHRKDTLMIEILRQFILQYYAVAQDIPKEILLPFALEDIETLEKWIVESSPPFQGGAGGGESFIADTHPTQPPLIQGEETTAKLHMIKFTIPQRGVKKQLIAMGELNAKEFLREQGAVQETARASKEALQALLSAINIDSHSPLPFRIETYDISNIQGTLATASMIVFIDGMPAKKEYRKFKIRYDFLEKPTGKTLGVNDKTPMVEEVGAHTSNDFAMLEETLMRRFAHVSENEQTHLRQARLPDGRGSGGQCWPMPNLIIIDGGKGQLSSAQKSLQQSGLQIPMISIAKREEEIFLPGKKEPVLLPYDSPALYLIQRMRDEAHRFTITYHRNLRGKEQIKSILDDVPGIGPKTKKLLLQTFGSIKGIKEAEDSQLEKLIGTKKTSVLREQL